MELRDIINPILRWWWLLLAATGVAAVVSLAVASQQAPTYSARATLMIGSAIQEANPSDYGLYTSQQLAESYADIAQRTPVQNATMKALDLDWLPYYVVRPLPNTQLLEIAVTDTDPARTQAVANELAHQLILQSPTGGADDQVRQAFIKRQLDDLQVKIEETRVDIEAKQNELTNLTSARQIADAQNQIYALQSKLDTLRANYTALLANTQGGAVNSLKVIEPAVLPTSPVGPNIPMLVVTAAVIALVVAVCAVYLLAYLDNTIKSPEEIKRLTGLATLGGIPTIQGETYAEKVVVASSPLSPTAEAFRTLRTGVQFSTIDRPESTVLLVSSPNPSEGKSLTSANLAAVIAQSGARVLLIDADLRRPVVHKIFGVTNKSGLTEFLRNVKLSDLDESVSNWVDNLAQPTSVEGLRVLPSGPIPPNPSELLGSTTNRMLLAALKSHFDYILLDSPPVLLVTDAVVLSTQVDGVILVIDADSTQRNQLRQSVERMREVNANLLGVVANRLSPKTDGYADYYNYYYYRRYGENGYGYARRSPGAKEAGGDLEKKKWLKRVRPNSS